MEAEGIQTIEAEPEAERKWKQAIQDANNKTLLPLTDSWYMGANIPGKPREQLNYIGGIQRYEEECREALVGLRGFRVVYHGERGEMGVVEQSRL